MSVTVYSGPLTLYMAHVLLPVTTAHARFHDVKCRARSKGRLSCFDSDEGRTTKLAANACRAADLYTIYVRPISQLQSTGSGRHTAIWRQPQRFGYWGREQNYRSTSPAGNSQVRPFEQLKLSWVELFRHFILGFSARSSESLSRAHLKHTTFFILFNWASQDDLKNQVSVNDSLRSILPSDFWQKINVEKCAESQRKYSGLGVHSPRRRRETCGILLLTYFIYLFNRYTMKDIFTYRF
jgi:hypothetical protein